MSDITITCPSCSQQLEVPEDLLGQVVECPACNQSLQLPDPEPTSPPAPPSKKIVFRKSGKRSAGNSLATQSVGNKTKACPFCGEEILTVAVKCKHCNSALTGKGKAQTAAPQKQKTSSTAQGCGCLVLIVLGIAIFSSLSDCSGPSSSSSAPPKPKTQAEVRKERLEGGFSAWDGSHRGLTALIKKTMNDPKSYEHVETTYGDKGDHLIVKTTFRGKNAFGGVVANWVMAKTDLDGNVIEVIAQGP
jgi:predicted RNA-binding Zn-ribbon protein involved in translation (DUF1610 family)